MKDRVPLHSRLAELAGPASGGHPLLASRIADLHPFSWWVAARLRQALVGWPDAVAGWRWGCCGGRCVLDQPISWLFWLACKRPYALCPLIYHPCLCRFAVAWYPLYRVPEAPLTARFLTFHTLASL